MGGLFDGGETRFQYQVKRNIHGSKENENAEIPYAVAFQYVELGHEFLLGVDRRCGAFASGPAMANGVQGNTIIGVLSGV